MRPIGIEMPVVSSGKVHTPTHHSHNKTKCSHIQIEHVFASSKMCIAMAMHSILIIRFLHALLTLGAHVPQGLQ